METTSPLPFASFIDLMIDAVFAVDVNAKVMFASASCERIFGYTPQEMVGKSMFDMMAPEDRERTRDSIVDVMAGKPQLYFENCYIRKDGERVNIMWSARWSEAEQVRIGVARDITDLKRAESMQALLYTLSEAAHAAEDLSTLFRRIHQILGASLEVDNFCITLTDSDSGQLSVPCHIDQYDPAPVPSEIATLLCADIIRDGQPRLLMAAQVHERIATMKLTVDRPPLCWLGVPLTSHKATIGVLAVKTYPGGGLYTRKDQELLQFVSTQIATAIERLQMQMKLTYMAQYDQLTTLPNRGFLYDRLKVALSIARRDGGKLALLFLDLDRFKQVNDTLGHHVGDLLLKEVAARLKRSLRDLDTVARIGGDEFVVLLQPAMPEHAALVAAKIGDAMNLPFFLDGHTLAIAPSIGMAFYPDHGDSGEQLLKHADQQMYAAKNRRRGVAVAAE